MKKKKRKKTPLLRGHKKRGTRFVPPLMELAPLDTSVSYIRDMLPELIWTGLLDHRFGYLRAARILDSVFRITNELMGANTKRNFALVSTFDVLSDGEKASLRQQLQQEGILTLLQSCMAPLNVLYYNCPLLFLGPPPRTFTQEELVTVMKDCVSRTIDKYETPGVVLHAAPLRFLLITKRLKVSSDVKISNLNAVVELPDSDEAKVGAATIRAMAIAVIGHTNLDRSWARRFWNRNSELSPCDLGQRGVSNVDQAGY